MKDWSLLPPGVRLFVITLVLLPLLVTISKAQGSAFLSEEGKGFVHLYGGAARADHYYDVDGNLRALDTHKTSFGAVNFGVTANYGLTPDLELNLDLPIGYYSISSTSRFTPRSIFSPPYLGLGATYSLSSERLYSSISAMVKIPPGFHSGIYDDPKHPTFLSDGFLQITTLLNVGFTFETGWIKGGAGYTWRDEEPLDEIPYSFEVGLSRVPGTGIFVGVDGVVSTGDVTQPLRPFYAGSSGEGEERRRIDGGRGIFRNIDREHYFALTAGAFVFVTERIMIDGRYRLRLFGRNSLALQGAYLGVGHTF